MVAVEPHEYYEKIVKPAMASAAFGDVAPGAVAESRSNPSHRCVVRLVSKDGMGVHYQPLSEQDRRYGSGAYCGPGAAQRFLRDWKIVGRRTVGGVLRDLERLRMELAKERANRPRPDMTFPC